MLPRERLHPYVEDLMAGRREACRRFVLGLLEEGVGVRSIYDDVFRDSLYEVGRRWECGEASIAAEHTATAVTEELVMLLFPRALVGERVGRTAIVSCAADEYHQLGGRLVADTLELRGWSVRFLGAGVAIDALARAVAERAPDLVALSVSLDAHLPNARAAIEQLRAVAPSLFVAVGGLALQDGGDQVFAGLPNVRCLRSLAELEAIVEAWPP